MEKKDNRLNDWVIKKIEDEFSNDVCLLLAHNRLKLGKDMDKASFSYYIPATNRANGLARTFIVDGVGYDLFPIPWKRVEDMADIKKCYSTTVLDNAEILWARSEEDKQRFISLQDRLRANFKNPYYMREKAKEWFCWAKDVFQDAFFEDELYKVRKYAGQICDLLSIVVAYANMRYLKHGETKQIQEISEMNKIPKNFVELYQNIITEQLPNVQKRLCYDLITSTKAFLEEREETDSSKGMVDFEELAFWYQELSYWWRRVYYWCDENNFINAYLRGCMLQEEVDENGKKFGITDIDIMSSFDANDLTLLRKRAEAVEQNFRRAIEENGVKIDEYKTIEDFLETN